jgi:hypothetical protein
MIIHGQGPFVLGYEEDGTPQEIAGFYTTRWCRAASVKAAAERGMMLLRKEWTSGVTAHMDPDHRLAMEIDCIWRIGVFDIWRTPNRGYTFYSES